MPGIVQGPPGSALMWLLVGGLVLVIGVLARALHRARGRERRLVRVDPLTGLANRAAFLETAEREMARSRRYDRPFTVVSVDLDDFRSVNDRLGPSTGDDLLRACARTMQVGLRATDVVARMGNDEFSLLLPETDQDQAVIVLQKLRQRLLRTMLENGWPVTFSTGVATFRSPPTSSDELVAKTDTVLFRAKENGKDTVHLEVFSS